MIKIYVELNNVKDKGYECRREWKKNSKYFSSLEKKHAETKIKVNGNEITAQNDILNAEREFYEELYKKENSSYKTKYEFFQVDINKLDDNDKHKC